MGEFIDNRQAFDVFAVGAGIEHEVISPRVIGPSSGIGLRPATCDALTSTFGRQLKLEPSATSAGPVLRS
jgi:hypothetical protein